MTRTLVGSCSWTDPTLIACGRFYPQGVTSAEDRLRYYATQFPLVEVDSTYYAPPSERNSRLWVERTPDGFVFNVKAYGLLTGHPVRTDRLPAWLREAVAPEALGKRNVYRKDVAADAVERLWEIHRGALEPLRAAGRLGAALFQFPPWFVQERRERALPARAARATAGRHRSRSSSAAADGWPMKRRRHAAAARGRGTRLRQRRRAAGLSLEHPAGRGRHRAARRRRVCTDGTPTPGRLETAAASDRFKYLYAEDELAEWVPRVRELERRADAVHVLFNNNYEDWGMRNARRMTQLLGGEDGGDGPAGRATEEGQGTLL